MQDLLTNQRIKESVIVVQNTRTRHNMCCCSHQHMAVISSSLLPKCSGHHAWKMTPPKTYNMHIGRAHHVGLLLLCIVCVSALMPANARCNHYQQLPKGCHGCSPLAGKANDICGGYTGQLFWPVVSAYLRNQRTILIPHAPVQLFPRQLAQLPHHPSAPGILHLSE